MSAWWLTWKLLETLSLRQLAGQVRACNAVLGMVLQQASRVASAFRAWLAQGVAYLEPAREAEAGRALANISETSSRAQEHAWDMLWGFGHLALAHASD